MPSGWGLAIALVAGAGLWLARPTVGRASPALAAEPTAEPAAEPTAEPKPQTVAPPMVLVIVPEPASSWTEQLQTAIRAQAEGGGVAIELRSASMQGLGAKTARDRSAALLTEHRALGVLWVVPGDGVVELWWYEPNRVYVASRVIDVPDLRSPAAIETVANVVASVAAEVQQPVDEVSPAIAAPTTPREQIRARVGEPTHLPPRRWFRLWFSAAYAGNTFAGAMRWNHAVGLQVEGHPTPHAFLGVGYDVVIPDTREEAELAVELRRHPASLLGGYRFLVGERVDFELGLRATVDPIVRRTKSRGPVEASGDAVRVFSSLTPGFGVGVSPAARFRLFLHAGIEVLMTRARYVVRSTEATVLIDPHPVRFVVRAGFAVGSLRTRDKD